MLALHSTISLTRHQAFWGGGLVGMQCYFRGILSVLPCCGFPALQLYTQKRVERCRSILLRLCFEGAKIEDSGNIKRVISVQILHVEPMLKEMSASSADGKEGRFCCFP